MTKKELLDSIHGRMIISCQAVKGEPLYVEEKSVMYLMARAAKQAGATMIRTSSIRDVIAIKEETGLPVIGLVKVQYEGYDAYITPTMKEVDDLVKALSTGVWAIVVGGAITRPLEIAQRFMKAIDDAKGEK